jgi:transposase
LTGLKIIQMVCSGETDPELLSSLRHGNCKKSKEEIAKALQSNNRQDYLFGLQQELDLYKMLQQQMAQCDTAIERIINQHLDNDPSKKQLKTMAKVHKRVNKNAPKNMDISQLSYQYFGGLIWWLLKVLVVARL